MTSQDMAECLKDEKVIPPSDMQAVKQLVNKNGRCRQPCTSIPSVREGFLAELQ